MYIYFTHFIRLFEYPEQVEAIAQQMVAIVQADVEGQEPIIRNFLFLNLLLSRL
jgi:hypothetical protein